MKLPISRVQWSKTYRLIDSRYPPIDLFEDIADPSDWDLLASAESKTNPRIAETIGNLDLVPKDRRVSGAGATYLMAPLTHISVDKTGRFHDGTFGGYYAGNNFNTALYETIHHKSKFYASTQETAGWIADMRELIGSIDAELVDLRDGDFKTILDPDNYTDSQAMAREVRDKYGSGIVYPSVRHATGECFVAFFPDIMTCPKQGDHYSYHWNGSKIDMIKKLTNGNEIYRVIHE